MNLQRKTVFCLIAAFVLMGFTSVVLAGQAAIPVSVSVGKGTILTLNERIKNVSITDSSIAYVPDKGNAIYFYETCPKLEASKPKSCTQILINAKKIGNTDLIVWNAQGETRFFDITVTVDISQLQAQLKEAAPNDDITAYMAGDTIVLSGHAKNQQTIDKAVKLAQAYAVASKIITTTSYVGGVATEKSVSSGKVINQIIIDEAQQVMVEVKVAQINKNKLKELGASTSIQGFFAEKFNQFGAIGFPDIIGTPGFTPQVFVTHFPSNLKVFFKLLDSSGLGEILAEPNLIVRSGERGNFHVGTRYPILTTNVTNNTTTQNVEYIPIGVRLNFAPEVLENGAIRLRADYPSDDDDKEDTGTREYVEERLPLAEVSGIVEFVRTTAISAPIIETRTVNTSVDLHDGESLVLAGLFSEEMKKNIQKLPFIGDIPILGAFFRNTSTDVQQKELVFFITPKLVKPIPVGQKPALPTDKELTPEQLKMFDWIPLPGSGDGAK